MKTKNIFELDPERLATTDEHGNRVYLYPEDVKGIWKTRRTYFYWSLILLYLILPWININGKPALNLDIIKQEFTVMGFTLHGVEPILFFMLVAAGLFLIAFLTSLFGRIWCGWACPQTVFIQTIFMKIETLIEGKARARRELDKGPWTLNKIVRRSLKWIVFTVISLHIAHTFIGYFVGPRELLRITTMSPSENWGLFVGTMIISTIFLLDFGWFREQFCIIACPYGRMQSVVMDENSLVVAYNPTRGEPRRAPDIQREDEGDCINCYNCVKVCPTGIDIRRGNQLECIACTQCIDACDEIMTKLKRPTGLIGYMSENELAGKPRKMITVRSAIYVFVCLALLTAFGVIIQKGTDLKVMFIRSATPYRVVEDSLIVNHFTVKLTHQGSQVFTVDYRLTDPVLKDRVELVTPVHPTVLNVPEKKIVMFFKFNPDVLQGGTRKTTLEVYDVDTKEVITTKEVVLVGPTH